MESAGWEAAEQIICEEPDVPIELRWVWRAFWRLHDGRQWMGGGMGAPMPIAISFSAVIEWSQYYGHDDEMVYILDHCIREMDKVYLTKVIADSKVKNG